MFKTVALLTRRPDLSREEFEDYYERHHVPLITRLLPPFESYRRNYIDPAQRLAAPDAPEADFDVISEFVFRDRAGYEAMIAAYSDPETGRLIAQDEARFADRSRTRMYVVRECGGPQVQGGRG